MDNFVVTFLTAALTAAATTLVTLVPTFLGIRRKARADLENEHSNRFNTRKWEVYTEFTKLVPKIVANESTNMNIPTEIISVNSLASQIVIAGSDKVVTAFRIWRETTEVYGQGDAITKEKLFKLIAEMRKDLGNKYTQIEIEDLLGALKPVA